jgi:predicted ArsR family transcriptional regulator
MLSHLLGSKARVKILKLFLLNLEEKFYIRQIARDLDLQVNSVRRELDNLEKFGLLLADPSTYNVDT